MGVDGGARKAEVLVVLGDFFVDWGVMDGQGNQRNLRAHRAFSREEAAIDVVGQRGRNDVAVRGDELHAHFVEVQRGVTVVGDDDADRDESVLDVLQAEKAALVRIVAGVGGYGDVLVGMRVEGRVLIGGFGGRRLFVGRMRARCQSAEGY